MFKIFGVGSNDEHNDDLKVEVVESDEETLDEEVGQVALDVLETEDNIYIVAPIAGVEYEDIDLSINKTVLTIKGARQKPVEYDLEGINMRNSECFWGRFIRNIILPENLALNKIKAYMQNNLLVISVPKLRFDTKNIKINKMES
ncbi:MAG: Hsp20/alpha crystallin family protein [Candidatus Gracilibacteria bacterium]|nr:Hsp20/alpha crystallin family protein [Candidatus Gracilibacteria bacterium]